jgi:hypothetical protein
MTTVAAIGVGLLGRGGVSGDDHAHLGGGDGAGYGP